MVFNMATVPVRTLACVRNIDNILISYLWPSALALGFALSFALSAKADTITNRICPSEPTLCTLYNGASQYLSAAAVAPDGSMTIPIQAGASTSGVVANNAVVVRAGEVDTFSVY